MEMIIQLLGTAGYPASFVAASIFFIFLFQKQNRMAQETLNQDYQRVNEDNRKLREEVEEQDDELQLLREDNWKLKALLDMRDRQNPAKE